MRYRAWALFGVGWCSVSCWESCCGQAGGKYLQTPMGGDSTFKTVSVPGDKTYKMGDLGSKVLPEHPDAVTTWKIGTTPRVAWGMRYNQ